MTAIVIASDGRMNIVLQNLAHLTTMGEVFMTVSRREEQETIRTKFREVNVEVVPNIPLGRKWQMALDMARKKNPEIVVICGSDDILCNEYIANACKFLDKGFHFIGTSAWFMTDGKTHYSTKYKVMREFPAGSGRVMTHKCLEMINWNVFDTTANRRLDDKLLSMISTRGIKKYVSQEPEKDGLNVLALKGQWIQLNPINKFLNVPSIDCRKIEYLPLDFPHIEF